MTSSASATSWTDTFQAVGTVAAALIAAVGLLATVWMASRDRREFKVRLEDQRRESSIAMLREAERWASRESQRFQSSIILEIGREYAVWTGLDEPVTGKSVDRLRMLSAVLEPGSCPLLKWRIGALTSADAVALDKAASERLDGARRVGGLSGDDINQELARALRELGSRTEKEGVT
jgi:hypothetical protein